MVRGLTLTESNNSTFRTDSYDDQLPYVFNLDKYDGTVVWQDSDQQTLSLNLKLSFYVNSTENLVIFVLIFS